MTNCRGIVVVLECNGGTKRTCTWAKWGKNCGCPWNSSLKIVWTSVCSQQETQVLHGPPHLVSALLILSQWPLTLEEEKRHTQVEQNQLRLDTQSLYSSNLGLISLDSAVIATTDGNSHLTPSIIFLAPLSPAPAYTSKIGLLKTRIDFFFPKIYRCISRYMEKILNICNYCRNVNQKITMRYHLPTCQNGINWKVYK